MESPPSGTPSPPFFDAQPPDCQRFSTFTFAQSESLNVRTHTHHACGAHSRLWVCVHTHSRTHSRGCLSRVRALPSAPRCCAWASVWAHNAHPGHAGGRPCCACASACVDAQLRTDAQEARPQFLLRIMPAETREATRRDALRVSPNFAPSTSTNGCRADHGEFQNFSQSWHSPQTPPTPPQTLTTKLLTPSPQPQLPPKGVTPRNVSWKLATCGLWSSTTPPSFSPKRLTA